MCQRIPETACRQRGARGFGKWLADRGLGAQLSGWTWGWFKPLSYGFLTVSPYSCREVRADRTLYWIDVFPEENTAIEEELFVTQEGVFTSPVAEIESLYAPHYRANDSYHGSVVSARKVQLDL